ncbi:MAG: CHAT domain-containing protein [Pirellulales bacterium]
MRSQQSLEISILAVMFWLSTAAPLAAQDPGELQQFDRLHKQYESHFQKGQWLPAYDAANQLLSYVQGSSLGVPYEIASYECIGTAGRKAGKFKEALAAYQQLVAAATHWRPVSSEMRAWIPQATATGLMGVANCYLVLGPIEQAIDHYEQAIAFLKQHHRELEVSAVRAGLGTALARSGQTDRALQEFEQALTALAPAVQRGQTSLIVQLPEAYADALLGISKVHSDRGRFDLAEPYSRRAVNTLIAAKGERHPYVAKAMVGLANLYTHQNRLAEANALFTAAIDNFAAVAALDSPYALDALEDYAVLLHDADQAENSEKIARHVLEKYRAIHGDESLAVADTLLIVGTAVNRQGRHAEAENLVQQALGLYERLAPTSAATAYILLTLSSIQHEEGKYQEALAAADRALAIDQLHPLAPGDLTKIHGSRSLQLWKLDRRKEAREALTQSLQELEIMRAFTAGAERERATLFSSFKVYYEVLAGWLAADEDLAGMFQAMETLKARSLLDELRLGGVDLKQGADPASVAQTQQREQQLRQQLTIAQQQFDNLTASTSSTAAQQEKAAAKIHEARGALYQYLADVRSQNPAYRDSITGSTQIRSLVEVQQALTADQVLISYLVSAEDSYAVVVRADRATFAELKIDEAQARALGVEPGKLNDGKLAAMLLGEQGVLALLSSSGKNESLDPKLRALWQVLVPAAEAQRITNQSTGLLTIIPDGLLALLPFEALIVSDAGEREYLLDAGPPVNYVPSATVWHFLKNRATNKSLASEPILTLGDPQYAKSQPAEDLLATRYDVRSGDSRFRSTLAPLPYSGNEARWLKEHFQRHGLASLMLTQTQATEARLRAAAPGRKFLHLACHGMADASYGNLFGCLALAPGRPGDPNDDGFLYAAEISGLDLGACELAILSACQTNFGPEQSAEGVWNLSRAFLTAGARRVVASDWVVDDEAGATLVSYLAAYLAESQSADASHASATALWKAKQQLRRNPKWQHPFYWSSLVLIGPG